MRIKITRKQILQAIMNEPLKSGKFIHHQDETIERLDNGNFKLVPNPEFEKYATNTKCAVCAVGSILDLTLGKKIAPKDLNLIGQAITTVAVFNDAPRAGAFKEIADRAENFDRRTPVNTLLRTARKVARKGKRLSALSSLFESLMEKKDMRTSRGFANKKAREILVKLVKTTFPVTLVLNTENSY